MHYFQRLSAPKSCSAALFRHKQIFEKGVACISHTQVDGYYRCLLIMSADKVQAMLRSMHGRPDAWFKQQIAAIDDPSLENGGSVCDAGSAESRLALVSPLAPVVEQRGFARQICNSGDGSSSRKVYFDNFTGTRAGDVQRGFVHCPHHPSCIRYRPVVRETVREFCTEMYAWMRVGSRGDLDSKAKHLAYECSAAEKSACELLLVMTPF